MHKHNRTLIIIILGLLSAIGPFSIDMYLPGFPSIAADLNTTVNKVSYSLASFFLGVCIGQMLCGPLLDRYGRKKPLIISLVIYIIASIGCAISPSVEILIVCRFFQAIGGSVGMVAPRAIIRDVFPLNESAKIFSYMILILGVSPIIAPTAGSYIMAHFGWPILFYVLAIITLIILLLLIAKLPETKKSDPHYSLKPSVITANFIEVLKVPQFYIYALVGGISSAGLFAYLAGSPYIFMELYGASEQEYGYIFAIIAAGLILCSQLNNKLLKKFNSEQISMGTQILQSIIGITLFICAYFHVLNMYSTIVLMAIFLSCQGFIFPNSSALSMAPFSKNAGSASALMGALQMGIGALTAAIVGFLKPESDIPLTAVMAICATLGLLVLYFGSKRIAK